MLFLLNDAVLELETAEHSPQLHGHRFRALSFDQVIQLGKELFAQDPLLQVYHPQRARRLAYLILTKAPGINGALFVPPSKGCRAQDVAIHYCYVEFELMAQLWTRQRDEDLNTVMVDQMIWRRLAA